ncbi:MAG: ATP-binding protein [Chloroflexota bacterium]
MSKTSQQYTHDLRHRSIIGLIAIGCFILASQLIVIFLVAGQLSSSRVINLAGRQRMLSQRLTKNVLLLQHTSDSSVHHQNMNELTQTLQSWEEVHNGLQQGDTELGLPGSNTLSVTNLFALIEMDYQQIVISTHCILALNNGSQESNCSESYDYYLQTILAHENAFLMGMDAIVFQYDIETQQRIQQIRYLSYVLTFIGCIGVIGIWVGVLNPSIRKVEQTQLKLEQQANELAIARDEALRASSIKSQILMNISHDARTPLSTIILSTDILRKTVGDTLTAKQISRLDTITQNAQRLNIFLQNLLDQAKLEVDSVQLVTEHLVLDEISKELHQVLMPLAEGKGLDLKITVTPDFPTTVYGDHIRLMQILTNLGHNAIKFTEQGQVSISFVTHDTDYWGFRVQDTGMGMSLDVQNRIFDQFWQGDGSMTRQHQSGVGLGLAIVRSLIDLMQGRIYVKSEVDQGTEFEVWIPFIAGSQKAT